MCTPALLAIVGYTCLRIPTPASTESYIKNLYRGPNEINRVHLLERVWHSTCSTTFTRPTLAPLEIHAPQVAVDILARQGCDI